MEADGDPDGTSSVLVRLGGGRYAVPIEAVAEVTRVPVLTRVPGVPGWVTAVANWRGRVLPVLDLRGLLGEPAAPGNGGSRLVVLTRDGVTAGLLADSVEGVTTVGAQALEGPPATLAEPAAALVAGHVTTPDGPVVVLDVSAVYRLRGSLPRARRAG